MLNYYIVEFSFDYLNSDNSIDDNIEDNSIIQKKTKKQKSNDDIISNTEINVKTKETKKKKIIEKKVNKIVKLPIKKITKKEKNNAYLDKITKQIVSDTYVKQFNKNGFGLQVLDKKLVKNFDSKEDKQVEYLSEDLTDADDAFEKSKMSKFYKKMTMSKNKISVFGRLYKTFMGRFLLWYFKPNIKIKKLIIYRLIKYWKIKCVQWYKIIMIKKITFKKVYILNPLLVESLT